MRELYPEIDPFDHVEVQADEIHTLYVERCGNPEGKPALFLHGGPGSGASTDNRRYWDPDRYHIILFDQRGCGRSKPYAELRNNTTPHLIADIEKIREHLDIAKWQVFGGSWGSTLALAYAQTHPARVTELILRGIFLLRKREIDWFYQEGASRIFPDAWEDYLAPIPEAERDDLVSAYYNRLTGSDRNVRLHAARAWSRWEGCTSKLIPSAEHIAEVETDAFAEAFARIECHYFKHGGFFREDGELLKNIERIAEIPGVIVQCRYDVVCPTESAWLLHKAWPQSRLQIVAEAGHSVSEAGIASRLVEATEHFASMAS